MNEMSDMSAVIAPKSDQINAEDFLITGPITITVTGVVIRREVEQPVSISFENETGKVYRPCKSMCKVLAKFWGLDAAQYIGRRLTLFADPNVTFGPHKTGGIRISHMSHITHTETVVLRESKKSVKPFTVQPLKQPDKPQEPKKPGTIADWITGTLAPALSTCVDIKAIAALQQGKYYVAAMEREGDHRAEMQRLVDAAEARVKAAEGELEGVTGGDDHTADTR